MLVAALEADRFDPAGEAYYYFLITEGYVVVVGYVPL
jgi:hypothetical protein